jgi:hypothetical protein
MTHPYARYMRLKLDSQQNIGRPVNLSNIRRILFSSINVRNRHPL